VRPVALHVVKNWSLSAGERVPLILGIHGPSGDGKTYQCEVVLEQMQVRAFLISGGQLESGVAGEPAKLVRDTYLAAGKAVSSGECEAAVVLVNDVDTGLGSWGDKVQTTINTQTVYGELMHLVDYPTDVERQKTLRVPLILTGNDFTKLYSPLVRAGRMTSLTWRPTLDERSNVVNGIFPELSGIDSLSLVSEFPDQPVAFFAHLRTTLVDASTWKAIKEVGLPSSVSFVKDKLLRPAPHLLKLPSLIEAGKDLESSGQLVDHLHR
jgi:hypothetical protein